MTPLTTIRQFWAGVCALQDVTKLTDAINGWTTQREKIVRGSFLRLLKDLGYEHAATLRWLDDRAVESDYLPPKWHARVDALERQLAAEREAHAAELKERDKTEQIAATELCRLVRENGSLIEQFATSRADLDALTRWRLQSEEPCPSVGPVVITNHPSEVGRIWNPKFGVLSDQYWRFTPESLAAWKAREGSNPDAH